MEIALLKQQGRSVRVIEDCLNGRHFFDAGTVTDASTIDGIHLDADQHERLGISLAACVATPPRVAIDAVR
jgi:hypothetical protein